MQGATSTENTPINLYSVLIFLDSSNLYCQYQKGKIPENPPLVLPPDLSGERRESRRGDIAV